MSNLKALYGPMWKVHDLVLVEQSFIGQSEKKNSVGIIVSVEKRKSQFWGDTYYYNTFIDGELIKIGEFEHVRIIRRITSTSEEFWGKQKK